MSAFFDATSSGSRCMYWRADAADGPTFLCEASEEGCSRATCHLDGRFWEYGVGQDVPNDCPESYRCRYYVPRT